MVPETLSGDTPRRHAKKKRRRPRLKIERGVQILTQLSVIVGVVVGLNTLRESNERAKAGEQASKLQSLNYLQQFIREDFEVQRKITQFDYTKVNNFIAKTRDISGRHLYFSDDIGDLAEIGEHYERIGAQVRLHYLDFDLIYEIVFFPDEFWTKTRPLRKALGRRWDGEGQEVNDLWSNFEWLCEQYRNRRLQDARSDTPNAPMTEKMNAKLCKDSADSAVAQ